MVVVSYFDRSAQGRVDRQDFHDLLARSEFGERDQPLKVARH
ncbi:MAG TPA: hypothetical protein VIC02_09215 [Kineobactrum sp.]